MPSPIEIADLLFKKYALLKTEIHLRIQSFKNHARNFHFVGAFIILLASYAFFQDPYKPNDENKFIWLAALFSAATFTIYLTYDILESSYQILTLAERLASLERRINAELNQRLFIWESEIAPKLNARSRPLKGIWHPI
jgi:hypothetical protein